MKIWYEHDGKMYKMFFPFSVSDIPFPDHCDFQSSEQEYINICRPPELNEEQSNKEEVDNWEFPVDQAIKLMIKTVNQVIKSDLTNIPFSIKEDDLDNMIDEGYTFSLGEELSVTRMYAHIVTIVREYKPEKIEKDFTYKEGGDTFVLPYRRAIQMLTGKGLTSGESLEVLEYQRRFADKVEHTPLEVGNLDFTLGLTQFALLVRKKGESLPWDRGELEDFIEKRRIRFSNIMLDKALDLRFFLTNSLLKFVQTQTLDTSGASLRESRQTRKRRRRGKRRR